MHWELITELPAIYMSLAMCHSISCTMGCLPSSASTHTAQFCILLQVAAAVFAFRGTRLNKTGNLRADLHLLRDLNAEMVVTQRATKKIQNHIKRLQEQQGVKWSDPVTSFTPLTMLCSFRFHHKPQTLACSLTSNFTVPPHCESST